MFEGPLLDQRIAAIAHDFRAVSIFADAVGAMRGKPDPDLLRNACDSVLAGALPGQKRTLRAGGMSTESSEPSRARCLARPRLCEGECSRRAGLHRSTRWSISTMR